jgi:hypothetical protein
MLGKGAALVLCLGVAGFGAITVAAYQADQIADSTPPESDAAVRGGAGIASARGLIDGEAFGRARGLVVRLVQMLTRLERRFR